VHQNLPPLFGGKADYLAPPKFRKMKSVLRRVLQRKRLVRTGGKREISSTRLEIKTLEPGEHCFGEMSEGTTGKKMGRQERHSGRPQNAWGDYL